MNRLSTHIFIAAVMIALAVALVAARRLGLIGAEAKMRGFMTALGLMITVYGNVIDNRVYSNPTGILVNIGSGVANILGNLVYANGNIGSAADTTGCMTSFVPSSSFKSEKAAGSDDF